MRVKKYIYYLVVLSAVEMTSVIVINNVSGKNKSLSKSIEASAVQKYASSSISKDEDEVSNSDELVEEYQFSEEEARVGLSTAVDETTFEKSLFIGDSRMVCFENMSGISYGTFMTDEGLGVNNIEEKAFVMYEGNSITVYEALENSVFSKIYIEIGLNDLATLSNDEFSSGLCKMIKTIKNLQPDADIYLQSIIKVGEELSENGQAVNNENIDKWNSIVLDTAMRNGVYYLEVNEALISQDASEKNKLEGINLNDEQCGMWIDYLLSHLKL